MIRLLFFLSLSFTSITIAAPPRVLAWDDDIAGRKLALVSSSDLVPITGMHPSKRTTSLRLKGVAPFAIRAMDKSPAADGKPIQIEIALPPTIKNPLILLMPDASHATGLRPLVIEDSPEGFHWGMYRFLNATPKELTVQLEQKAVRVPAGWKPVDIDLGGETRGFGVSIALTDALDKPLYSAVWEYDKNARTLCILVVGTDARNSPVGLKAIPEDKLSVELEAIDNEKKDK